MENRATEYPMPTATVAIKCNEAKDVLHCLQQAARSAAPVTLDLNHVIIDHPQHLAALRNLCSSAASHVTLSNGTIVLGGGGKPVLSISCGRLSFKGMEIVRVVTATAPPPPKRKELVRDNPPARAIDVKNSMVYIAGSPIKNAATSTHVTLEDCTLRMEGDPRYNTGPAILAMDSGAQLSMDNCKLLNVHPMMQVHAGAQVELHDCHVGMVYGTLVQLNVFTEAHVSLHGCTLVEEEGTFMPPAASLLRLPEFFAGTSSICVALGSVLRLVNTRVRMPLGAQLGRTPYVLQCTNSTLTATGSTFESTFVSLHDPASGCHFTRCGFSASRITGTASAFLSDTRHIPLAVLLCDGGPDLVIEDCTFTNATDRAAIQRLPQVIPPSGSCPFLHVKGCNISNCLHGIQVAMVGGKCKGQLTVEVEDTTIEVTPSPITPQEPQTCLFFEGPAVSATVRRCVMKAAGKVVDVVLPKEGAHLVMTDCTVTLHGPGTAMVLGLGHSPATAVIERTTITADAPAKFAATVPGHLTKQGRSLILDGTPLTMYGLERALQRGIKGKAWTFRTVEREGGTWQPMLEIAGEPPTALAARRFTHPPLLALYGGTAKLVDCKVQGSEAHNGIRVQGGGKAELVGCEIAVEHPMLRPWAAVDPHSTISLRDCCVGECVEEADAGAGTSHMLDNTPYPPWWSAPPHTQPPGSRPFMFAQAHQAAPDSNDRFRKILMTYIIDPASACTEGGAGDAAIGCTASSGTAGSTRRGPVVAPGGDWWPDFCNGCDVDEAEWAAAQGDPSRVMPWCQGCTCVRYCSRECQLSSWSEHKPLCQYISQHYSQATGGSKASKDKEK